MDIVQGKEGGQQRVEVGVHKHLRHNAPAGSRRQNGAGTGRREAAHVSVRRGSCCTTHRGVQAQRESVHQQQKAGRGGASGGREEREDVVWVKWCTKTRVRVRACVDLICFSASADVLFEGRGLEVLIHGMAALQQLHKVVKANVQRNGHTNGRPQGVAATNPLQQKARARHGRRGASKESREGGGGEQMLLVLVGACGCAKEWVKEWVKGRTYIPELEHVGSVNAKLGNLCGIGRERNKVLGNVCRLLGRLKEPCLGRGCVGDGLLSVAIKQRKAHACMCLQIKNKPHKGKSSVL